MEYNEFNILKLREEISALPLSKNGKRLGISSELKTRVIELFHKSDLFGEEYSKKLGISYSVFGKWKKDFSSKHTQLRKPQGFKKLQVNSMKELPTNALNTITLDGPCGLRITGLTPMAAALVWKALC